MQFVLCYNITYFYISTFAKYYVITMWLQSRGKWDSKGCIPSWQFGLNWKCKQVFRCQLFFSIDVHTSSNEFVFHVVLVTGISCVVIICRMSLDHLLVMNTRVQRPRCLQWCLGAIITSCKYNCHKTMFYNMHIVKRPEQ